MVTTEGKVFAEFGGDKLKYPHELAVFNNGDIVVANTNNNSIDIFYAESSYSGSETIKFPKSYGGPKTISVSNDGRMFVGFTSNQGSYILHFQDEYRDRVGQFAVKSSQLNILDSVQIGESKNVSFSESSRTLTIYDEYCSACHDAGKYGAPATGMIESWAPFSRDLNELTLAAISGKGAMIARGGCDECSYEDLYNVIKLWSR